MSAQLDNVTTYRRMAEAHLDTVVEIEQAIHIHPWSRGNFADSIRAGYHCWIAERGAVLVGYGVVIVAADEAHLLNLSVAPQWQRCGIGAELARFFLKLARDYGAKRMFLEVRPSNVPARALYTSLGFDVISLRRDYYPAAQGREDAVVMERSLK